MFIREIWENLPRLFFEILKPPSFDSGDFIISKK